MDLWLKLLNTYIVLVRLFTLRQNNLMLKLSMYNFPELLNKHFDKVRVMHFAVYFHLIF